MAQPPTLDSLTSIDCGDGHVYYITTTSLAPSNHIENIDCEQIEMTDPGQMEAILHSML